MSKEVKDNSPNVSFHSFSEITTPEIIESSSGQWVEYGVENLYPQFLIEKFHNSAVHGALVTGISQFIAGFGVTGFDLGTNREGDTTNDLVGKLAFDIKMHGYFTMQVIYNIDRTKIVELIHTPAEKWRSGIADKAGVIHSHYLHDNWVDTWKTKPKKIQAFNTSEIDEHRQLMVVRIASPGQFYYSAPDYVGAMNYIALDDAISVFHLNNIENGFFPSAVIQFFTNDVSEDAKRAIERKFSAKFGGQKGKKLMFVYNKNKNQKIDIDTFEPADLDERFKNLNPQVTEKIMVAHRVTTPMLFGIKSEGTGFGNNANEMQTGLRIFNNLVIIPFQQKITRALNKINAFNGVNQSVEILSLQPSEFLGVPEVNAVQEVAPVKQFADVREVMPDDMVQSTLDELDKLGQRPEELEEDYELIDVPEDIPDSQIGAYLQGKYEFAISSEPNKPSKLDGGLYKIRYQYAGPRDDKNRTFCAQVLSKNLIYRKEDISQMSFRSENKEFGTYSIFFYKGSYNCRHRWQRLVYFRKRTPSGQFLPNEGLKNDKRVPVSTPEYKKPDDKRATKVNKKVKK